MAQNKTYNKVEPVTPNALEDLLVPSADSQQPDTRDDPRHQTQSSILMHDTSMVEMTLTRNDDLPNLQTLQTEKNSRTQVGGPSMLLDNQTQSEFAQDQVIDGRRINIDEMKKVQALHMKNSLEKRQYTSTKEFMNAVTYNLPLNELYRVMASCQYTEDSDFCPVLVEVMYNKAKGDTSSGPFLLQVWSKDGDMVYEKELNKPVSNWNIAENKFLFQEQEDSPKIHVVTLFLNRPAHYYIFKLPQSAILNHTNTKYDEQLRKFVVPPEATKTLIESDNLLMKSHTKDLKELMRQGELTSKKQYDAKGNEIDLQLGAKSVNEMHSTEIIQRAPDKMIEYLRHDEGDGGYILLAYRDMVLYFQVKIAGSEQKNQSESKQQGSFEEVDVRDEEISYLTLDKSYKIICMQEIGNGMSAIVLEHMIHRTIRFLRIEFSEEEKNGSVEAKLDLVQLGVFANETDQTKSKLLKYRSAAKYDKISKRHYQVSIVLRENGRFEVYSDFMLVYEKWDPTNQCVDIETDFDMFYFKFAKNSHLVRQDDDVEHISFEMRQARHFWRNRIGYNTSKKKNTAKSWEIILHKRISGFFKIYTQLLNFGMFMLVSHRNMISVYNMGSQGIDVENKSQIGMSSDGWLHMESETDETKWIHTEKFEEGFIRQMFLKKRSKTQLETIVKQQKKDLHKQSDSAKIVSNYDKYQIMCVVGTHTISICDLSPTGMILRSKTKTEREISDTPRDSNTGGRIIRFMNDDMHSQGTLILIDNAPIRPAYLEVVEKDQAANLRISQESKEAREMLKTLPTIARSTVKLFQFPYEHYEKEKNHLTLFSYYQGTLHKLLDSKEPTWGECLAHDSYFKVMKARTAVFETDEDMLLQKDEDKVEKAFDNSPYRKVIVCTTELQDKSTMFMIEKKRDGKVVTSIDLIKNKEKTNELEVDKLDEDGPPLHSFFITEEEYGDDMDSFIEVSKKRLTVYDQQLKISKTFEGLNIRECMDVHQSYLYTISDQIDHPFEIIDEQLEDAQPEAAANFSYSMSGFYAIDLAKLLEGKVEKYKVSKAIGGVCSFVDNSKFSDRFSFIKDYNTISVIPFPHLNLINCIGMGQKHEYSIWREKNGFFTALDSHGTLNTWALSTGKYIYGEQQTQELVEDLEEFEVYRADQDDITYTRDFYNFENESLNLLKSKKPLDQELAINQSILDVKQVDKMLAQQDKENKDGSGGLDENLDQLSTNLFKSSSKAMAVNVVNSQQRSKLYLFKVMQLKVFEDIDLSHPKWTNGELTPSECKVKFNFTFPLIEKSKNDLKHFDWDVSSKPQQRLYLSKDTKYLLQVINNFIGTVFHRGTMNKVTNEPEFPEDQVAEGQEYNWKGEQVEWTEFYHIKRFPRLLVMDTSVPYLFSPNFKYMLDFNYKDRQFEIKETRSMHVYMRIPKDLMDINWGNKAGGEAIKIVVSRIKWDDERTLRIINESNIECLFEIRSKPAVLGSETQPEDRYLHLLSSTKIDNMYENMGVTQDLESPHLLLDRAAIVPRDVLSRLIRTNQRYKKDLHHALNLGMTKDEFSLLSNINRIDYNQPWNDQVASFDLELSYTMLDWLICEMEINDGNFSLPDVDLEQKIQLCFNIFPNGRGVLHKLAIGTQGDPEQDDDFAVGDQIQAFFATENLFQVASEKHDFGLLGIEGKEVSFEIPILQDKFGNTPLDICLDIKQLSKHEYDMFEHKDNNDVNIGKSLNTAIAELIFDHIKGYGIMHSSFCLNHAIIKAIEIKLSNINEYLESRLQRVDHFFLTTTQHELLPKAVRETTAMGEYGMVRTNIWTPEYEVSKQLFDFSAPTHPTTMNYLDIPQLYTNTPEGMKFIYQLAKADIEDQMPVFGLKSVQIMIDAQYERWFWVDFSAFFMPELVQLMLFWYWSNIILINLGQPSFDDQNTVVSVLLLILIGYFVLQEIPQIYNTGFEYFKKDIKYYSFVSNFGIVWNVFTDDQNTVDFWTIQTWIALILWLRFLIKMTTFSDYSAFIRMVTACVKVMIPFMVVLFIGVFAFADAFESIDQVLRIRGDIETPEQDPDASEYEKYFLPYVKAWQKSFLYAMGEFDGNLEFFRESDWLVFFFSSLFNLIVLLNLLIAIISDEYAVINENRFEHSYREKCIRMAALQDTIFGFRVKQPNFNEFIFIAKVTSQEEIEAKTEVPAMEALNEKVDTIQADLKNFMQQFYEFEQNNDKDAEAKNEKRAAVKKQKAEQRTKRLRAKHTDLKNTPNKTNAKVKVHAEIAKNIPVVAQ